MNALHDDRGRELDELRKKLRMENHFLKSLASKPLSVYFDAYRTKAYDGGGEENLTFQVIVGGQRWRRVATVERDVLFFFVRPVRATWVAAWTPTAACSRLPWAAPTSSCSTLRRTTTKRHSCPSGII